MWLGPNLSNLRLSRCGSRQEQRGSSSMASSPVDITWLQHGPVDQKSIRWSCFIILGEISCSGFTIEVLYCSLCWKREGRSAILSTFEVSLSSIFELKVIFITFLYTWTELFERCRMTVLLKNIYYDCEIFILKVFLGPKSMFCLDLCRMSDLHFPLLKKASEPSVSVS